MLTINLDYASSHTQKLNQSQKDDIQYAAKQWEQVIENELTINIIIYYVDTTGAGFHAMCIPGICQTETHTLTRPLAKLTGTIKNPHDTKYDLIVIIDSSTQWRVGHSSEPKITQGEHCLSTTMMHEFCHGLGFLGLGAVSETEGFYSSATLLLPRLQYIMKHLEIDIPYDNFILGLTKEGELDLKKIKQGMEAITPFDELLTYADAPQYQHKGQASADYHAFMGKESIYIKGYVLATAAYTYNQFYPFSTCTHIVSDKDSERGEKDKKYLMNPSITGQYYATPDKASLDILEAIGWNIKKEIF